MYAVELTRLLIFRKQIVKAILKQDLIYTGTEISFPTEGSTSSQGT